MNGSGQQPTYAFAGFRVDAQRRVLASDNGRSIPLPAKAFDTLLYFVERPGQLLEKRELLEAIWPNVVVEENNLNQAISTLRRALGEHAGEHRFVVTEPGRGYRFVARVNIEAELPETSAVLAADLPKAKDGPLIPTDSNRLAIRSYSASTSLVMFVLAGLVLLAVAFMAVNYYLLGTGTHDVPTASSAPPGREQPITFVIHAPDGSTFGLAPADPVPALSPDGTQLAFVAPWESSDVVWVQRLGNPEARPLVGTQGSPTQPMWSPDGRYIAFGAEGRLKRISATGGGAPREITVTDDAYPSGTWNADDTIVFAGNAGLYRVPADGGEARLLTRIDETRGEFSHRFPVMLPDGARFLYLVLSKQDDHTGLYLGSLHDPEMKVRLLPDDSNAALGLGPSGRLHLLFVRNSALLAQPFDASRGALTGDPMVIAEPIDQAPSIRFAAFAASGRVLVYRPRFAPSNQLVWIDRGGIRGQIVGPDSRRWRFPALSPDGTRLVALREDRSDTSGLWLFDLVRSKRERLASGGWVSERSGALMSAWTPDSSRLVYSLQHPNVWGLYQRPVTGAAESLFAGPTPVVKRVRDATDDFVLFHDNNDFWLLPFMGDRQAYRLPIEGNKNHGRVSADGRWLAYDLIEAGMTEVYVTAFPKPAERWPISTGGGSDPQWRHDGRELYYIAGDQTLMVVSVETGATFNATTPEPLFRASFDRTSLAYGPAYAPAPDGQRFLVVEVTGGAEPRLTATLNWTDQR